jgi:NADH-quinone oxidoreductase subunit L
VTKAVERFLEPTFHDSRFANQTPATGTQWLGLVIGALLSVAGIAIAYQLYERRAGYTLRLRDRYRAVHDFLAHKWYFDELYDALFVHPMATAGRFGRTVIEIEFVQGVLTGGTAALVRAGTAFARSIQTGYLRAYALLLLMGLGGLLLYFLLVSS